MSGVERERERERGPTEASQGGGHVGTSPDLDFGLFFLVKKSLSRINDISLLLFLNLLASVLRGVRCGRRQTKTTKHFAAVIYVI